MLRCSRRRDAWSLRSRSPRARLVLATLVQVVVVAACADPRGTATPTRDASALDAGAAMSDVADVVTTPPDIATIDASSDAAIDASPTTEAAIDVGADARESIGPIVLGTGLDRFEDLPREGGNLELVHGPQGGWHVFGRVRLRGIAPDVYLTFALVPVTGGAQVNVANETVRRQERRGLALVGDAYESTTGELVILAEGLRPGDVVGRRFRFTVRVERPDPVMLRVLVGSDERGVTVIDEVE